MWKTRDPALWQKFFLILRKHLCWEKHPNTSFLSEDWGLEQRSEGGMQKREKKIALWKVVKKGEGGEKGTSQCTGWGALVISKAEGGSLHPLLLWYGPAESASSWLVSVLSPRIPSLPSFSLFVSLNEQRGSPESTTSQYTCRKLNPEGLERYFKRKTYTVKTASPRDTWYTYHAFSVLVVRACVEGRGRYCGDDSLLPPFRRFQVLGSPGLHNKSLYLLSHLVGQYSSSLREKKFILCFMIV